MESGVDVYNQHKTEQAFALPALCWFLGHTKIYGKRVRLERDERYYERKTDYLLFQNIPENQGQQDKIHTLYLPFDFAGASVFVVSSG